MKRVKIYCILLISFLMLLMPSVLAGVTADFYWLPTSPKAGDIVTFFDNSFFTNGEEYQHCSWNWEYTTGNLGQDDDAWGSTVSHIWTSEGSYHIDHWVRGTDGNVDAIDKYIYISNAKSFEIPIFTLLEKYPRLFSILTALNIL